MYKVRYDPLGNTSSTPARHMTPFGHMYESKVPVTRRWLDAQILYPPSAEKTFSVSSVKLQKVQVFPEKTHKQTHRHTTQKKQLSRCLSVCL